MCIRITEWNLKAYSVFTKNCQDFTKAMLEIMKIKPNLTRDHKLGEFIHSLEDLDQRNIPFTFRFAGELFTFSNHRELDQFCWNYHTYLTKSTPEAQQDRALLKAFDRVFWLRYYAASELKDEMHRHDVMSKCQCLPAEKRVIIDADFNLKPTEETPLPGTGCYFHDPAIHSFWNRSSKEASLDDEELADVNHNF
eukprot:TRINITY_DN3748_c0_g1_i4.p1 TRINITY_DN3748_c0_g1~~TRINITY_DN3748_c0_g1_i4.p1  ORF type:complete len:195 (+),score=58.22 TRINITY_DN3748_c0_g1_i4:556-1140(+)